MNVNAKEFIMTETTSNNRIKRRNIEVESRNVELQIRNTELELRIKTLENRIRPLNISNRHFEGQSPSFYWSKKVQRRRQTNILNCSLV